MAKTLRQFIAEHRQELDAAINGVLNRVPRTASCNCHLSGTDHIHNDGRKLDAAELRLWILNDEGLYQWARSEGVRI